ncbi:hypothetical protein Cni_G16915 [Canna indica]|uniref:Transmembrane protein n=1 Tax=Canna indica TaxID=4628 RepID=A0AAQ3KG37_9LILI|nr:hypothetical protein Cni_G16915 [Canna indica]
MKYFSWNDIKNAVCSIVIIKSLSSSPSSVRRLLSFGSSNDLNQALPVSSPQPEPQPPSLGFLPSLMVERVSSTVMTATQVHSSSTAPSTTTDENPLQPKSIAELAIPAALSVGIYGSIPADVQLNHDGVLLYDPLVAFICLGVFASLCSVMYALARRDGGANVEASKQNAMAVAVGFSLVAFVLRVLLLLPITSLGLVGFVFLLGASVVAIFLFLPCRKKEDIHNVIAPDPAPSYSVENRV